MAFIDFLFWSSLFFLYIPSVTCFTLFYDFNSSISSITNILHLSRILEILPDPKVKDYCLDCPGGFRLWAGDLLILGGDSVEQTKLIQPKASGLWGEFPFPARKLHLFYQGTFRFLSSLTMLILRLGVFPGIKWPLRFVCTHCAIIEMYQSGLLP